MNLLNKTEMLERLVDNVVEVNFTKVSGETRKMRCTLRADLLPPQQDIEESTTNVSAEERMIVWDVDKSAWRSFRLDSITSVLTPAP
jgi:hypothetical protein